MRGDSPARLYLTVENPLLFSACDCNPPSAATDQMLMTQHPAWERFFARRCPHLEQDPPRMVRELLKAIPEVPRG